MYSLHSKHIDKFEILNILNEAIYVKNKKKFEISTESSWTPVQAKGSLSPTHGWPEQALADSLLVWILFLALVHGAREDGACVWHVLELSRKAKTVGKVFI